MKNNVDFQYEYSDLNLFQTRVQVLTGKYTGMVIEYGSSHVVSVLGKHDFTFDWTLYKKPDSGSVIHDDEFQTFLADLLIAVIDDRNHDKDARDKLMEAASVRSVQSSKIKIPDQFYQNSVVV